MRGKVKSIAIMHSPFQDHPRLCGEKASRTLGQALRAGSPPPMRGKVLRYIQYVSIKRITPAYAGKSVGNSTCGACRRDHPRLCGEKIARSYYVVNT